MSPPPPSTEYARQTSNPFLVRQFNSHRASAASLHALHFNIDASLFQPQNDEATQPTVAMYGPSTSASSSTISKGRSSFLLSFGRGYNQALEEGLRDWLQPVPPASAAAVSTSTTTPPKPPSDAEVKLLREALGALYGERNPIKAEGLLGKAIVAWERQNPDERAALYRVRGDCYMELQKPEDAAKDYAVAIELLDGPGGELADPAEKPAARLGRARAMRSSGKLTKDQSAQAASDYQIALRLLSREDWDTDAEREEDGATRNPYAAWEWGTVRRGAGDFAGAAEAHALASFAFDQVGDKAHSVMSSLDAGIDLAASGDVSEAKKVLEKAIKSTSSVEGRDIDLLQRVIAKKCEARIALASMLWDASDRVGAERQLGDACVRLEQMEADAQEREAARVKSGAMPPPKIQRLKFSIDHGLGAGEISCARFKNEQFVNDVLEWPEPLQKKLGKLERLGS